MTRKAFLLGLSIVGVSVLGTRGASAQFQPGNVWPNPGLSTAAPAGVDQVYSYYNSPPGPNVTGDSNPRPNGWHRGGSDFGVTTAPNFCFYNTPGNSAGEGTAPPGNSDGYALEVNDTSTNGYGEWFSDWNAIPLTSNMVDVRFFYELTNLTSTQRTPQDQFRVTVNFGDQVSQDITSGDPNNLGHTDYLWNAPGQADVTTWTQVDELLAVPAGSESMRITVDSGGSSQATGQLWVSDISVAAVPEPTCIAGIATGSMLLLARRRRAKQA
jgi:hypothetical protein